MEGVQSIACFVFLYILIRACSLLACDYLSLDQVPQALPRETGCDAQGSFPPGRQRDPEKQQQSNIYLQDGSQQFFRLGKKAYHLLQVL